MEKFKKIINILRALLCTIRKIPSLIKKQFNDLLNYYNSLQEQPKIVSKNIKWYGWKKDNPDHRDFRYKAPLPVENLPVSVDLRKYCPAIETQGELGSCTANALVANIEFLEIKENISFIDLSRLFLYYNERECEGTIDIDSGAAIRDGIKVLKSQGVCPEVEWPYIISNFRKKPNSGCYFHARKHTITAYQRLSSLIDMKSCLASGYPFVFGFSVYSSFESDEVSSTGMVPMPAESEECLGGHAVMAVGYDDIIKKFIVRNSWGKDWGIDGYFYLPYEYITHPNLADDFWTITQSNLE